MPESRLCATQSLNHLSSRTLSEMVMGIALAEWPLPEASDVVWLRNAIRIDTLLDLARALTPAYAEPGDTDLEDLTSSLSLLACISRERAALLPGISDPQWQNACANGEGPEMLDLQRLRETALI